MADEGGGTRRQRRLGARCEGGGCGVQDAWTKNEARISALYRAIVACFFEPFCGDAWHGDAGHLVGLISGAWQSAGRVVERVRRGLWA